MMARFPFNGNWNGRSFFRSTLCRLAIVLSVYLIAGADIHAGDRKDSRPNIVLINADDLGYGDLGCYGATKVRTPNIDKLAKQGRRFTDAHSASAVCSPSRYGLLTGQYPHRRNLWGPVSLFQPLTVNTKLDTIASVLRRCGYATACIGKWHLGFGKGKTNWNGRLAPGPLELGFHYYFGIPSVNSGPPFVYVENHAVVGYDRKDPFVVGKMSIAKKVFEKGGYNRIGGAEAAHKLYDDWQIGTTLRKKSMEWIGKQKQPYFLYLATTNIHHPFTPAKQFQGTSKCGAYGDFIHELDWIVGGVVEAVEKSGDAENTLIIFTSDNGGMLNVTGQRAWQAGHRLNGVLLGFKFGAWEGGHRIPFIAKWPGRIPADTTSDRLISHIDLLATFAAIGDVELNKAHKTDSINQLPELLGKTNRPLREELLILCNSPKHMALRTKDWLFIDAQNEGGFDAKKWGQHLLGGAAALKYTKQINSDVANGKIKRGAPPAQLYNLDKDVSQSKNVYAEHPSVANTMRKRLLMHRKQTGKGKRIGWLSPQ